MATEVLKALIPSGLRRLRREHRLRSRYGLADLGSDDPYRISVSSTFGRNCRLGGRVVLLNVDIGDYSYIESDSRVSHASVGRFTSIANFVQVGLAAHPVADNVSLHPAFYLHRPDLGYDLVERDLLEEFAGTTVGNDVWIGAGAVVVDGVTIGDGAVVGAGAVVTRDIPPYAVAAGVPARVLRYRFDQETIDFLLELRWWDRPVEWLREHAELMQDVEALRRAYGD